MDQGLFERILEQLRAAGTVRELYPTLQNEPLLDAHLDARVRTARAILGSAVRIGIVTNGQLLQPERAVRLAEAGVDVFEVSVDAARPETYAAVRRGLDFDLVTRNLEALLRLDTGKTVVARFLRLRGNEAEEAEFARRWTRLGAAVRASCPTDRLGAVRDFASVRPDRARPREGLPLRAMRRLLPPCFHPFAALHVLRDGTVLTCCHDWRHRHPAGNLATQSLEEVWDGEPLRRCRAALWGRAVDRCPNCGPCATRLRTA